MARELTRKTRAGMLLKRGGIVATIVGALFLGSPVRAQAQDEHAGHDHAQPAKAQQDPAEKAKKKKEREEARAAGDKEPKTDKPATVTSGKDSAPAGPLSSNVKAVVDAMTYDFGEVWAGPLLKHAFKITNQGTEPLEIRGVKPACGCTAAGESPKVIKPGETGEFPFSLKSETLNGKFSKSIDITTNEKDNSKIKLTLQGVAKQRIELSTPSISFGSLKSTDSVEKTITIKNNDEKPLELKLTGVNEELPYKTELIEKEPGKLYELRVVTVPPLKEGTHNGEVKLATNFEDKKEILVRINAVIPPRLALRPPSIVYNSRLPKYPVRLTNNGDAPVKVTEASVNDERITAKVTETSPGKIYTIEVEFPSEFVVPEESDIALTLETDDKEQPTLTVPIKAPPKPPLREPEKLVGKPAPSFSLVSTDGKPVSNDTLKSGEGPIVLNFWAADCGFCKLQLPRLEKLHEQYSGKNVRWVNVASKRAKAFTEDEIKEFVKANNLNAELVIDLENKAAKEFKVQSYPALFVLGKTGNVEKCVLGNAGTLEGDLKKTLDQLLGLSTTASAPKTDADEPAPPAEGTKPGADTKAAAANGAKPGDAKASPETKASPESKTNP